MSRISEITTHVLKSYEYAHGGWVLVRVRTEDDIEGVGECFVPDRHGSGAAAMGASPMMTELVREPVAIRDGRAQVPSGPGLGVELDEGALERYTIH